MQALVMLEISILKRDLFCVMNPSSFPDPYSHYTLILAVCLTLVTYYKLPYTEDMAIDLHAYKELYLKTARDLLTRSEELMKQAPEGVCIEDLHRTFHSLKSQSLVMGYMNMGLASKALEELFKYATSNPACLTTHVLADVTHFLTQIDQALSDIEHDSGEPDLSSGTKKINTLISHLTHQ